MDLTTVLKNKNMTMYELSKRTKIPFSTISKICNGKRDLEHISFINAYKISRVLNISMEDLIKEDEDQTFIRSRICHELKNLGDLDFLRKVILEDRVDKKINSGEYFEGLYTLAIIDYLYRKYNIPKIEHYQDIRDKARFPQLVFPAGMIMKIKEGLDTEEAARKRCIPEFLNFNIAEEDIYDVA